MAMLGASVMVMLVKVMMNPLALLGRSQIVNWNWKKFQNFEDKKWRKWKTHRKCLKETEFAAFQLMI